MAKAKPKTKKRILKVTRKKAVPKKKVIAKQKPKSSPKKSVRISKTSKKRRSLKTPAKKRVVKKKVVVKKVAAKKKLAAKKKPTAKKKVIVKKKVIAKKKPVAKKSSSTKKRTTRKSSASRGSITKIKVVGVGGCGGNVATRLYDEFPRGVEVVVINTDLQDLAHTRAHKKLYIGKQTTRGLGAGMDPELGSRSAEENREEITQALVGSDMVFVTAGFGGGTGSGAAPIVAEIAKEMGILTVAVVTRPFSFEGEQRSQIAEDALGRLRDRVDTFIIITNDNIFSLIDAQTPLAKAFSIIDGILKNAVVGVAELILSPGIINVDFADIKYIMQHSGPAIIGAGIGKGKERALMAANAALNSPLLETSIDGAKGILFSVSGRKDVRMNEINEIAKVIAENADSTARIIFGTYYDRKVSKGTIKVTLIATGFGSSYSKNHTLFTDFDTFTRDGIIDEEDYKESSNPKPEEKKPEPISEVEESEEESMWDVPAFLRKKGRKK